MCILHNSVYMTCLMEANQFLLWQQPALPDLSTSRYNHKPYQCHLTEFLWARSFDDLQMKCSWLTDRHAENNRVAIVDICVWTLIVSCFAAQTFGKFAIARSRRQEL
jgi:hypothetical protein